MSNNVYLVCHHKGIYDAMLGEDYSSNSENIVKCFSSQQKAEHYCNQFPHIDDETEEYSIWDYYTVIAIEVE